MKQFLNKDIEKHRDISAKDAQELKKTFLRTVELTKTVFGDRAFRRFVFGSRDDPNGTWEMTKLNRGLYDIIMFGFSRYEKHQVIPFADTIREELLWLMTSHHKFIDALGGAGTDHVEKLQLKFDTWLAALRLILGYQKVEPRSFSYSLKEQFYKSNSSCAICNQQIQTIDDSEIDHVEFYWRGGQTIPKNARLVHRFCNRSRGGGRK